LCTRKYVEKCYSSIVCSAKKKKVAPWVSIQREYLDREWKQLLSSLMPDFLKHQLNPLYHSSYKANCHRSAGRKALDLIRHWLATKAAGKSVPSTGGVKKISSLQAPCCGTWN
jgi:hypothetical protein